MRSKTSATMNNIDNDNRRIIQTSMPKLGKIKFSANRSLFSRRNRSQD